MTDKEYLKLTSGFCDIKQLILREQELKKEYNKARKKLKTKELRYSFLKDIVGIDINADDLVIAVVKLFKAFEFDKVENLEKLKNEDLRIWFENKLILVEITGVKKIALDDDKSHSISKHININKELNKNHDVTGLTIVNHDNKKHFTQRNKSPFRPLLDDIGKANKYSLITTDILLKLFIEYKQNLLTKQDIINILTSGGVIKK